MLMLSMPVLARLKLNGAGLHKSTTICFKLLVVKLHSYFQLLSVSFFVV